MSGLIDYLVYNNKANQIKTSAGRTRIVIIIIIIIIITRVFTRTLEQVH